MKKVLLEGSLINFILEISQEIKWYESDVTRSIIDELIFRISKDIKEKVKVVLLDISLINFIFGTTKEIKGKVKVVLIEVSLINVIIRISKEIKWNVKVV